MIRAVRSPRGRGSRLGWWILGALLASTIAGSLLADRDRWPGPIGDESTYLMQAESVARDGDLRFQDEDLARYRARHGQSPEVILMSGDGGRRIVFGKPFLYAVVLAPFVAVLGDRGALLLNALCLAVAGLLAALALAREGSSMGPGWVAIVLFASVAFGHVFWVQPDLFLMAAAASGLAVAHLLRAPGAATPSRDRAARVGGDEDRRGGAAGWWVAGALLAIPGAWRPPYLLLLLPGALLAAVRQPNPAAQGAEPRHRGSSGRLRLGDLAAYCGGVLVVAALALGGQYLISGSWSPYAGERRGFSELEGFPGIDFPASEWSARVESKGNASWVADDAVALNVSPSLAGWNLLYLLFGRTVGLLPYFAPALSALFRRRPSRAAAVEVAAGLGVPLAFLVLYPFNFYGGAGALANRYFLPAYPMLWFAAAGPARCAATLLVAAPFLWPLWTAPAAYPMVPGEGYRYVSAAARRLLPVETTQRHVKAPGRPDVVHGDLWVRFLDGGTRPADADATRLSLEAGRESEILVGRGAPLGELTVEALGSTPVALDIEGPGTVESSSTPRQGRSPGRGAAPAKSLPTLRRLALERPTARHPMWWTDDPFWLYRIELSTGGEPASERVELRLEATARTKDAPGAAE
jgi:hypothetical protein